MGVFGKLFSSKKSNNTLADEDYLKTIIESGKDEPLAVSNNNAMYVGYNELGGYYYLQTYIIGALNIKTKTGAKLVIDGNDYNLKLNSDMSEFESDPAHPLKAQVTKIDFEIEKNDVQKLKRSSMKQLTLTVKKKEIVFNMYKKE